MIFLAVKSAWGLSQWEPNSETRLRCQVKLNALLTLLLLMSLSSFLVEQLFLFLGNGL